MKLIPIDYNGGVIYIDKSIRIKDIKVEDLCWEEGLGFRSRVSAFHKTLSSNFVWKVVAQSPNLSLPNIPYVEIEEDVEQLAVKEFPYEEFRGSVIGVDDDHTGQGLRGAFVCGYEAASAKKYTESDMEAAVCFGMTLERFKEDAYKLSDTEEFKCFLESLQPKIESIEIEMKDYTDFSEGDMFIRKEEPSPVTYQKDDKTYLKVKQINYDK